MKPPVSSISRPAHRRLEPRLPPSVERSGTAALLGLVLLISAVAGGLLVVGNSPLPASSTVGSTTGEFASGSTSAPATATSATTQAYSGPAITVYAHRIPAPYWAPCFALTCSAGTGPGTTMYFVLYNSSGGIVQTGFANENGYAFTGLKAGTTYYLYPEDCDMCHGSTHDVIFAHWGDGNTTRPLAVVVGSSVDAWFSCTNGCS